MHLYGMDYLQILATRFGLYLGTDNATINKTRALRARMCVEVDLSEDTVQGFPIVVLANTKIWPEAKYEKYGFYCMKCHHQWHMSVVYRVGLKRQKGGDMKRRGT